MCATVRGAQQRRCRTPAPQRARSLRNHQRPTTTGSGFPVRVPSGSRQITTGQCVRCAMRPVCPPARGDHPRPLRPPERTLRRRRGHSRRRPSRPSTGSRGPDAPTGRPLPAAVSTASPSAVRSRSAAGSTLAKCQLSFGIACTRSMASRMRQRTSRPPGSAESVVRSIDTYDNGFRPAACRSTISAVVIPEPYSSSTTCPASTIHDRSSRTFCSIRRSCVTSSSAPS